jgi:hypothetical protein
VVGALVLAGVALHVAWMVAPAFGAATLIPAALAGLLMALFLRTVRETRRLSGGTNGL